MPRYAFLCTALAGCLASPLSAQVSDAGQPARNWATGWAGMYSNVDQVGVPGTGATWVFDDNVLALGAGVERELGQGLQLGIEASYARADFEQRGDASGLAGSAGLLGLFATGRLQYGGAGVVGVYLKGMAGAFGYLLPASAGSNYDLALSSGAGLEYRYGTRTGVYLEWNRIWAYHEKEGIDDGNTGRHSLIRLGLRRAF